MSEPINQCQKYINDPSILQELNPEEKINFYKTVRDLYISSAKSKFPMAVDTVKKTLETLPPIHAVNHIYNMSPYPSCVHTMVYRARITDYFAQYADLSSISKHFHTDATGLQTIFICPLDLSYHNFENIISFDSQLRYILDNTFKLEPRSDTQITKVDDGIWTIVLDDTCKNLLIIDDYDLYLKPLNSASRGGQRIIIKSNFLSKATDELIKKLGISQVLEDFSHTNEVFRYNKFEADDNKFVNHYDTPYIDDDNNKRSKFTILLYLTAPIFKNDQDNDANKPTLIINGHKIYITEPFTCVIFDQKYEHEGYAYQHNKKIFMRTEIIKNIKQEDLQYSLKIAKLFNIACYMTSESLFHNEFKASINDMFNRVNALRSLECKEIDSLNFIDGPLLLNSIKGIYYVTNGHNYYFLRSINMKTVAIVILLDYFNARCEYFGDYSYKQYRTSKVLCPDTKTSFTIEGITQLLSKLMLPEQFKDSNDQESSNIIAEELNPSLLVSYDIIDNQNEIDIDEKEEKRKEIEEEKRRDEVKIKDKDKAGKLKKAGKSKGKNKDQNKDKNKKDDDTDSEVSSVDSDWKVGYVLFGYDEEGEKISNNHPLNLKNKNLIMTEETPSRKELSVITLKSRTEHPIPIITKKITNNLHLWKSRQSPTEEKNKCCSIHHNNFRLCKNKSYVSQQNKLRRAAVSHTEKKLGKNILKYPVILMGNTISINPDNITINDGVINFGSDNNSLIKNKINFAACAKFYSNLATSGDCNIDLTTHNETIDTSVTKVTGYKLPEITYNVYDNLIEASIDMFKNGNYIKDRFSTYAATFNNDSMYPTETKDFDRNNMNNFVTDILSTISNKERKLCINIKHDVNGDEIPPKVTLTPNENKEAINLITDQILNKDDIPSLRNHVINANMYGKIQMTITPKINKKTNSNVD
jgi:hypothetical protein